MCLKLEILIYIYYSKKVKGRLQIFTGFEQLAFYRGKRKSERETYAVVLLKQQSIRLKEKETNMQVISFLLGDRKNAKMCEKYCNFAGHRSFLIG